jgi:hypothetical protein
VTASVWVGAPELDFAVLGVDAVEHAAVPTLRFRVHVDAGGSEVRALALSAQVRLAANKRAYSEAEREGLYELFGAPAEFGRSRRRVLWTHVTANVPAFDGETVAELHVPCTYDLDVVASKYLNALEGGDVPVELLFSGTLFFVGEGDRMQAAAIPWDREAACSVPVAAWREALERAFPGSAWLRLRRDTFDRLLAYRSARALLTWDAALEELLP